MNRKRGSLGPRITKNRLNDSKGSCLRRGVRRKALYACALYELRTRPNYVFTASESVAEMMMPMRLLSFFTRYIAPGLPEPSVIV